MKMMICEDPLPECEEATCRHIIEHEYVPYCLFACGENRVCKEFDESEKTDLALVAQQQGR